MAPIRVGVVGYGFAAKSFHLPFISAIPDYEVVAILQRAEAPADPASAAAGSHCTVDFPKARHHRTADAFFADADIDFVVVATHTDTHVAFAEKALEAGKHVIVDKPFGRSAEEVDRAIALALKKGRILTCFQNRRWDGGFQTLRQLVHKGALGDVKEAEIVYDFENAPWLHTMTATKYTPGDGMAFGLGTHSVDQAVTLFGRPKSVTAFFRAQRGIDSEVEDSFTIILQYDGPQKDLLVTVKTAVTSPVAEQLKFYVRGTKGSYIKHQQRSTCPQEEQIAAGTKPLDEGFGVESDDLRGVLTTYDEFDSSVQTLDPKTKKYTGRYPTVTGRWIGIYENVADAINGKAELEVKAQQSRDAIRVIELARESHENGVTVAWK
ncbi:oxidoreductase domain-containing protein [Verticillium alfalfae VaMs.102]|uniref:Oxidoreductase domain-containing protein n=1 Tax=Verticillium alfalfae (strain VaMs.102 / ATCC MYA-4576 / FGSC 10136) TaxID=526221 RepID=C9SLF6_VERA1|nr:oxidoreductase domain-containing protein [Verticillium alfalfae VaMs.102]EEY19524.1 oxidoreductase domain-containing protein [Verticillium alfalfae VaMs.102]